MTALLDSAALDQAGDTGTTLPRLVRAEFMKLRTTDTGGSFSPVSSCSRCWR
jgi:hypothetical protein